MVSERSQALAAAVEKIRERHGFHAVTRGAAAAVRLRREPAPDPLPPWWPAHLPSGLRTLELAGPRSCGKLSLALLWLAGLVSGGLIAVLDQERTFYPPAAAAAGLDLERLVIVRPPDPRETVEAAVLLAGCAGFDAVLWPMTRQHRPNGAASARIAHAAQRGQTRLLTLLDRPATATWTGLAQADVRLAVSRHQWRWVDGELRGADLTVACERVRELQSPDWTFTLGYADHGAVQIVASGAQPATLSVVSDPAARQVQAG